MVKLKNHQLIKRPIHHFKREKQNLPVLFAMVAEVFMNISICPTVDLNLFFLLVCSSRQQQLLNALTLCVV